MERRLSARLREETSAAHAIAERSGAMHRLLRGQIDRDRYCAMLRNLHALYDALEGALDRHAAAPAVGPVRFPALFRARALAADLDHLHGPGWSGRLLVPAMRAYVERIRALSEARPDLLAAHAYVRYLGDLSGGQVLAGIVRRSLGLEDGAGTAFYALAGGEDPRLIKEQFRRGLDALPATGADDLVAEARDAFARHVRLFEELDRPGHGD